MKTTRLIGLKWKRREACSLQVLIGRGLDHKLCVKFEKKAFKKSLFNFEVTASKLVSMAMRSHLFPYRTQKLSSSVSKILGWRRPGKIERCRYKSKKLVFTGFLAYSSLAQSVERSAVNRNVVGSSPTGGATIASNIECIYVGRVFCYFAGEVGSGQMRIAADLM